MRNESKQMKLFHLVNRLAGLGIDLDDLQTLRRIEMTLHRWAERECNGEVERDEKTGKPMQVSQAYINGSGEYRSWPIPDRESGAINRLVKIMAKYPKLWYYHQTDPRGCALYVGSKKELGDRKLDSNYTIGVAVCL